MSEPAPHGPRGVGPETFAVFAIAAIGTPLLPFFPHPLGVVLGAVGIVGALVLVTREDRFARGLGAGLLSGFAVGALVFAACFAIVASSI